MTIPEDDRPPDFIRLAIADSVARGKNGGWVHTRFPPEPNGYLHIGHATAISLNFKVAEEFQGACNLRFDDTNPTKEEAEYAESQIEDIQWLGYDWGDRLFYASDYFDQLYEYAKQLIKDGNAYVDGLNPDQMREYRGTLVKPGIDSPYRNTPIEENLALFERMKAGEFNDGDYVLRAKINMASPNINMRDPTMYRIRKVEHYRTGGKWCIYPMYDYAHPVCDAIEGITFSLCTLEYEDHRPLYDWFLDRLDLFRSRQIEFARFNLSHTLISKRRLLQLIGSKRVSGWDDPRMPTLRALRRRGYTPESIREFCDKVGIGKTNTTTDIALLEHCIRNDLNRRAPRRMAVLRPLKVIIENMPDGKVEFTQAVNNPEDPSAGTRQIAFSRTLYIEREDFMEDPPRRFYRLAPGREVRLRYGYFIKCNEVIKDETGEISELRCTYDPETKGGFAPDGRKVKATLHWVSADTAIDGEIRLYENLFTDVNPGDLTDGEDWEVGLNPDSLVILEDCKLEPSLKDVKIDEGVQFERQGYFCLDPDTTDDHIVFNRTVSLRDTWARVQRQRNR